MARNPHGSGCNGRKQVDGQFNQIATRLAQELDARRHSANRVRHNVIPVTVRGSGQLESTEANVAQHFAVRQHASFWILNALTETQDRVVWLHHRVGHVRRRKGGECLHDAIRVIFADLQAVATLSLLPFLLRRVKNNLPSLTGPRESTAHGLRCRVVPSGSTCSIGAMMFRATNPPSSGHEKYPHLEAHTHQLAQESLR